MFAKLWKVALSFVMSVHLSVCLPAHIEQLGSHWMDLHEICYSGVSFYDGLFYDDSLLQPLLSRIQHSWLVVHRCCNSNVLSLLSVLLALFQCACVSSFSILVQFFKVDCDFSTHDVHQKERLSSFAKRSEKNKEDCNFRD